MAPSPPAEVQTTSRRILIEAAGVVILLLVLHAIRLPEVWRDPKGMLWGNTAADALKLVWTFWHVAWNLDIGNGLGTATNLVRFPQGGVIWPASPIEALLMAPLTLKLGAVCVYNILQAAHFALAGAGYYALARHWKASVPAALAVTPIFALSGALLCTIANGNIGPSQAFWLPWTALVTLHAIRSDSSRATVLAGALLGIATISNIYVGIATGLVIVGVSWTKAPKNSGYRWLKRIGAITAVGVIIAAPVLAFAGSLMASPETLINKPASIVDHMRILEGAAAVESFFSPGVSRGLDPSGQLGAFVHATAFGWVALALGIWAILSQREDAKKLSVLLFIGVLMAMGPQLKFGNALWQFGDRTLPLPYAILDWLPPFDMLIELWRFSVISQFALGLLVLTQLRHLPAKAVTVLGVLLWAEAVWLTPGTAPWKVTPLKDQAIEALFEQREDGPVLHFPIRQATWPLYYQTLHNQPIANTPEMAGDPGLFELIRQRNWRPDELRETLRVRGYRWFVLHTREEMHALQQVSRLASSLKRSGAVIAEAEDLLLVDLALLADWGDARYRSKNLEGKRNDAPATYRPADESPTSPRPMAEPGLLPPDRHTPNR